MNSLLEIMTMNNEIILENFEIVVRSESHRFSL